MCAHNSHFSSIQYVYWICVLVGVWWIQVTIIHPCPWLMVHEWEPSHIRRHAFNIFIIGIHSFFFCFRFSSRPIYQFVSNFFWTMLNVRWHFIHRMDIGTYTYIWAQCSIIWVTYNTSYIQCTPYSTTGLYVCVLVEFQCDVNS